MFAGMWTNLVTIGLMVLSYPVYIHFLGYERYGLWLALSTVLSVALLGNLGIANAVSKLCAEAQAQNDQPAMAAYVATATFVLGGMGVLLALVVTVLADPIAARLSEKPAEVLVLCELLPYVAAITPAVFLSQLGYGVLAGLGRMDLSAYLQLGARVAALALGAGMLYAGYDIWSLWWAQVATLALALLLTVFFLHRLGAGFLLTRAAISRDRFWRLVSFGGNVVGGSALLMLLGPFNKLMIGRFLGMERIPLYEVAYTSTMQLRNLLESGLRAAMPEISRIDAQGLGRAPIRALHRRLLRISVGLSLPAYLGGIVLAEPVFRLWLGSKYVEPQALLVQIALVGSFLSLIGTPAYYSLMGMGRVRDCLASHVVQSLVNVLGVVAALVLLQQKDLVLLMGVVSLALASTTFYLLWRHHVAVAPAK
jgi:O-antigen/teichoic acid export membrane protein